MTSPKKASGPTGDLRDLLDLARKDTGKALQGKKPGPSSMSSDLHREALNDLMDMVQDLSTAPPKRPPVQPPVVNQEEAAPYDAHKFRETAWFMKAEVPEDLGDVSMDDSTFEQERYHDASRNISEDKRRQFSLTYKEEGGQEESLLGPPDPTPLLAEAPSVILPPLVPELMMAVAEEKEPPLAEEEPEAEPVEAVEPPVSLSPPPTAVPTPPPKAAPKAAPKAPQAASPDEDLSLAPPWQERLSPYRLHLTLGGVWLVWLIFLGVIQPWERYTLAALVSSLQSFVGAPPSSSPEVILPASASEEAPEAPVVLPVMDLTDEEEGEEGGPEGSSEGEGDEGAPEAQAKPPEPAKAAKARPAPKRKTPSRSKRARPSSRSKGKKDKKKELDQFLKSL